MVTKTRKVVVKEDREGIRRRVRETTTSTDSNRTRVVAGARKATRVRISSSSRTSTISLK